MTLYQSKRPRHLSKLGDVQAEPLMDTLAKTLPDSKP